MKRTIIVALAFVLAIPVEAKMAKLSTRDVITVVKQSHEVYLRAPERTPQSVRITLINLLRSLSGGLLHVLTTSSTGVTNNNTQVALDKTYDLPANTLLVGDILRIRMAGSITNEDPGAFGTTFRMRIGGVVIADYVLWSHDDSHWSIEADLIVRAIGSSGSLMRGPAFGAVGPNFNGADLYTVDGAVGGRTHGALTLNTTVAKTIDVTTQWNDVGAFVINTVIMDTFTVELIRVAAA